MPQCKLSGGTLYINVKCPGTNTKRPWTNFRGRGGGPLYTATPGPNVATAQLIFYIACIKKNIVYSVYLFIKVKHDKLDIHHHFIHSNNDIYMYTPASRLRGSNQK